MSTLDPPQISRTHSRLQRLRSYAEKHAGTLLSVALVAVLAWFAQFWLGEPFGSARTLGKIWVDSPEIYTRERLVNDRFIQDAWLSQNLNGSRDIVESMHLFGERRSTQVRLSAVPASGAALNASPAVRPASGSDGSASGSSRDRLLAELDFRELIRNLAAENQLDDRHDLNGNSLYRFKFDASILPGHNTQATAVISVRLKSSYSAPTPASAPRTDNEALTALSELGTIQDIDKWRRVYGRWIESLRSRLNQTHKELKQGYASNEFAHNDYVRLIGFLERNLGVPASKHPSCPSNIVNLRDQGLDPARLTAEEHTKHKACVRALIEKQIEKLSVRSVPQGDVSYIVTSKSGTMPSLPSVPALAGANDSAQRVAHEFDRWLNAFFAGKSVQLVLGVSVPDFAFVTAAYYDVKTLEQLIRLTFFSSQTSNADGNVFSVAQRIYPVAAIDPKEVSEERFKTLSSSPSSEPLAGFAYDDFKKFEKVSKNRLLVSSLAMHNLAGEAYTLSEADFQPIPNVNGVYIAIAELGLLNFVRKARVNAKAFTYAATPKESADNVSLNLDADARIDTGGLPALAKVLGLGVGRETGMRAVTRRGSVVGFGAVSSTDRADFGWIIGPRVPSFDGQNPTSIQGVGQYSLSALVSLPSWWDQVVLEVVTYWVGRDGQIVEGSSENNAYTVEVPTDFEPLEATLLEVPLLGPELMESRLDPVALTACRSGAIVIPGRRLWRSTRVTLGYQSADEISVLPNMKGIVATFREVQNQMTLSEAAVVRAGASARHTTEIRRPVRVWTSQGSLTLPNLATIGIPDACQGAGAVGAASKPPTQTLAK